MNDRLYIEPQQPPLAGEAGEEQDVAMARERRAQLGEVQALIVDALQVREEGVQCARFAWL